VNELVLPQSTDEIFSEAGVAILILMWLRSLFY